jgi:hypothetical protein
LTEPEKRSKIEPSKKSIRSGTRTRARSKFSRASSSAWTLTSRTSLLSLRTVTALSTRESRR